MDKLWTPLVLIIGTGAFLAGFFAGTRVVAAVLIRRERRLAHERRVLNEGWAWLYRRFGVDKLVWMAAFGDSQRPAPENGMPSDDE